MRKDIIENLRVGKIYASPLNLNEDSYPLLALDTNFLKK